MKIDRLIGILSVLLQEEKTTAPELAERFEVSRRTINRDIEDLCKAGIPIRTAQGTGGGISIMDGYSDWCIHDHGSEKRKRLFNRLGQTEEWYRMDLVGFCPEDLRMTAGGD